MGGRAVRGCGRVLGPFVSLCALPFLGMKPINPMIAARSRLQIKNVKVRFSKVIEIYVDTGLIRPVDNWMNAIPNCGGAIFSKARHPL